MSGKLNIDIKDLKLWALYATMGWCIEKSTLTEIKNEKI